MQLFRLPEFVRNVLPQLEWRKPGPEKNIYLTFDDGPIPEVTDFVLEQLQKFQAKGTFFCVGENLEKHPEIAARVVELGHRLGNHTFNHLKAWKTSDARYLENVEKCATSLQPYLTAAEKNGLEKPLFRPPYGQVSYGKINRLLPHFRIIMWDLLTCDYDIALSPGKCLAKSLELTRPGAIVVFHDSLKARRNLEYVLPRYLEQCYQEGYSLPLYDIFGTVFCSLFQRILFSVAFAATGKLAEDGTLSGSKSKSKHSDCRPERGLQH